RETDRHRVDGERLALDVDPYRPLRDAAELFLEPVLRCRRRHAADVDTANGRAARHAATDVGERGDVNERDDNDDGRRDQYGLAPQHGRRLRRTLTHASLPLEPPAKPRRATTSSRTGWRGRSDTSPSTMLRSPPDVHAARTAFQHISGATENGGTQKWICGVFTRDAPIGRGTARWPACECPDGSIRSRRVHGRDVIMIVTLGEEELPRNYRESVRSPRVDVAPRGPYTGSSTTPPTTPTVPAIRYPYPVQ